MYDPEKLYQVFHPHAAERAAKVDRFAYYTRAETALSVIQNESIWLRKTTCMNDYRELSFGKECLADELTFKRDQFRQAIDGAFEGLADEIVKAFETDALSMVDQTYIACVSEHDRTQDEFGRLSMWRAYGGTTGVAIIFKREAAQLPGLPYYATPVLYTSQTFGIEFDRVINSLASNRQTILQMGRENVREELLFTLRSALVSIKHKGFEEEREWRIVHHPHIPSPYKMNPNIRVVNGVPQIVHEISLKRGRSAYSLVDLIDRVIVGPTQYPKEIAEALICSLAERGVVDAVSKVLISDIPLRHNA